MSQGLLVGTNSPMINTKTKAKEGTKRNNGEITSTAVFPKHMVTPT